MVDHPHPTPARVPLRRIAAAVSLALMAIMLAVGLPSAHAAGIPEDECKMSGLNVSICAYVTNRVLRFGDQPGGLVGTGIEKSRVRVANGNHAVKGPRDVAYNDATYDDFSIAAFKVLGFMTFQGTAGPLSNAEVTVRADYDTFKDTDPDKRIGLTCEGASYFVCETYPVWMKNRTGDAAYLDDEGYIYLFDRYKDLIISGGENISSIEVEDVLYRHPAVLAAAVVAKPDPKWGETPCAFLELKPGAEVTPEDIVAHCKKSLAGFKVPRAIVFGELPKTSTGKIQKFELRKKAGSATAIDV